jgi:hypothetical protein
MVPELLPPPPLSTDALHVCRPYDWVAPLPSVAPLLPPWKVQMPPSPHGLSTSAGKQ